MSLGMVSRGAAWPLDSVSPPGETYPGDRTQGISCVPPAGDGVGAQRGDELSESKGQRCLLPFFWR